MLAASSFCRVAEVVDQPVDDGAGQPRAPWPAAGSRAGDRAVSRCSPCAEARAPGRRPPTSSSSVGVERVELGEHVVDRARPARPVGQVVADDQLAVVVDAGRPARRAAGRAAGRRCRARRRSPRSRGRCADHLEPLRDRGDVADGDQVLDLERGQGAGDLVEPQLVALERGQRLVGPGQDRAGVLEDVPDARRRRAR